jgi:hypothetical protein
LGVTDNSAGPQNRHRFDDPAAWLFHGRRPGLSTGIAAGTSFVDNPKPFAE